MFSFKPSKKYLLLLLFIIPISFTKKFHDIWEKYVIDTLLTHFEKKLPNDVIVLAFMVIIICQLYQKIIVNRYIFSLFQQISVVFTLIVYVIYRFDWIEHPFTFTTLSFYTGFVYWDLIILIPPIVILPFWAYNFNIFDDYWKIILGIVKQNKNGFMLDIPHKPKKETTENEIITELVKRLLNTESKDNAFAVGVVGEWGTGKTTLLNQIKYVLAKENNKPQESIIIDFNPWNSTNSQSIITDFFEHFREELSIHSAEIADSLQSYTQKLASIEGDDWLSKGIKIMTSLFGNNKTMIQEYEHINTILTQINRQIFVFIDDLDRLDKKEIIEVIRLIRNSANFHNTFFIVAYEKSYVEQAIEELNPENKSFFLEKIFQLELHLPKYEYEIIAEDLCNRLILQIPFLKENTELKAFIMNHQFLSKIIQNFRDVKRFVNAFSLVYTKNLAEEIYFPDFFHIELLRFKYPLVYDLLRNKTDMFFNINNDEIENRRCYNLIKNKENVYELKLYLESHSIYSSKYHDSIIELILQIFGVDKLKNSINYNQELGDNLYIYDDKNKNNKMKYKKCFYAYFKYDIYGNMIGNSEFSQARKNITSFKAAIDKWSKKNVYDYFIMHCNNIIPFFSIEEKQILIEGIFYYGRISPINVNSYIDDTINIIKIANNNKEFIKDLLINITETFSFDIEYLFTIEENNILTNEEKIEILFKNLQITINTKNIFYDKFKILERIHDQIIYTKETKNIKKANDIIIDFLKENLINCLNYLIYTIDVNKDTFLLKSYSLYFFDSWENFETILRPLQNDKKEVEKFWKFYDLCKAVKFEKPVAFEFEHLDIK